ncbi:MAG: BLUF domain-containing protein [Vicinamibacteraceae bacterium]
MLHFLVYVSSATVLFSKEELLALLASSRENNHRLGVSGMLLYKDGNLMQVLEGERDTVRGLYARIATDPRHKGVLLLMEGSCEARQFEDWSMAFRDLTASDEEVVAGYNEFFNTPLTAAAFAANPSRAQKLLMTFRRAM